MDILTYILRLLITFVMALAFGAERQRSHKPVGFGTFIFVAIGSCSLAIVALNTGSDPLTLLAAIVTGIGFLGAGALIKTTNKIFGFTTAASIWLFAILGLIIGVGFYEVGIVLYVFIWISIFIDKHLESSGIVSYQKRVSFVVKGLNKDDNIMELFSKYKIRKHKLLSKKIDKDSRTVSMNYLLEGLGKSIRALISEMEHTAYFREISLN